jgi:hypothetical protein
MRRGARLEARTQTRHLVADTFGRIVVVFRKGFGLAYNGDDSIGLLIAKHAYCISTRETLNKAGSCNAVRTMRILS